MSDLFESILTHLEHDGVQFRRIGGHTAVEMAVAGDNGSFRMVIVVDAERGVVRYLTFVEGKVPEHRRREVMEFLTRANYGLLLGNFELDLSDGEVRFKVAHEAEPSTLSHAQFQSNLYLSVAIMDRYFPGLQRVIQGSSDAAAAIADIET
ncbi:MAG: YbjN domain-containing protein [Thermoanaerobaculaceae bacterium]|mgnify:FL=1|nr:YbjN domain-containing protein [Thermoanaerobaculaceae bacterium]MDI9620253.1 YbjN domain-containing protein [Acidobacteriota bacterium]NLH11241.1 YbjN domain-containing protein [Holophagae bacterium]HPW56450.1 YbjN domain-containing protein [Thermoanaerobaculaceae bacterium]